MEQQYCFVCGKQLNASKRSLGNHLRWKHPEIKRCYDCGVQLTEENWHKNGNCPKRNICKECHNKRNKILYRKPTLYEHHKKVSRLNKIKLRLSIFQLLGGKCVECGFTDYRALQIDHVKDNGHLEKKRFGSYGATYLYHVHQELLNGSKEYQLLCANCNQIKIHRLDDYEQTTLGKIQLAKARSNLLRTKRKQSTV